MYDGRVLLVSVVVPVYSGEAFLRDLVSDLETLKTRLATGTKSIRLGEVIFVDDGSIDGSPDILDEISDKHDWITVLNLARNYGQHPATIAGILHSSGDWVVTLDEDLQHPPSAIPELLLEAHRLKADVLYARSTVTSRPGPLGQLGLIAFRHAMKWLTGVEDIRKFTSFRVIRGAVARAAGSICGPETYFDIALSWFTNRIESVEKDLIDPRMGPPRKDRRSLRLFLMHVQKMAFSSRINALRVGAVSGIVTSAVSAVIILALVFVKLVFPGSIRTEGWTSLMLSSLFFGGFMLILLGMVLEYLALLVQKAHGRPVFFTVDRAGDRRLAELENLDRP